MERNNEQHDNLIDLGAATAETKGSPVGNDDDTLGPRKIAMNGLSDD